MCRVCAARLRPVSDRYAGSDRPGASPSRRATAARSVAVTCGLDHRRQTELRRLGEAPVGVADRSQLTGEAQLAEAGQRPLRVGTG